MLVLSRHRDETIMVGDDVEITVVDIRGDKVRLGITAPTRIAVHRKEVYEAIQRENQQAAQLSPADAEALATTLTQQARPRPADQTAALRPQRNHRKPSNSHHPAVREHQPIVGPALASQTAQARRTARSAGGARDGR
ncbi:MAG: carbon storage regulator [Planctomycetota bacterium]|nr:MAG: carbon storage regulator [Planctomycetota bacterium]